MAAVLAVIGGAITLYIVASMVYQVVSHPTGTQVVASAATNIIGTSEKTLYK